MCNKTPGNKRAQQISSLLCVPALPLFFFLFLSLVSVCLKHEEHQYVEVWAKVALQGDFTPSPLFPNTCKLLTFSAKLSCYCYIHIVSP